MNDVQRERHRIANREWKRKWAQEHRHHPMIVFRKTILQGKCPTCTMFLTEPWHIKNCQVHIHQIVYTLQGISLNEGTSGTLTLHA